MSSNVQYTQNRPIMGDIIEELPSDQSVPSHNEIRLVDQLFKKKKGFVDKLLSQTKDILIVGCLFVLFSMPFVDGLITKFITIAGTSPYILIGIKALMFVVVYFLIKNLYLARK